MKVGVVKEIKSDEYRVALTPAGARELVQRGHEIQVETGAGEGSAFTDGAYRNAVAYETVEMDSGALPLRAPMSEIAGRLAAQAGAYFLEKPLGGRGLLLGGVPGVAPGRVVVIGGGIVGYNSAVIAIGLGANVTILERSIDRMRHLEEILSGRVSLLMSSTLQIEESVREADVVIGAVLIPGARAPKLVTRAMISAMKDGAVVVDV